MFDSLHINFLLFTMISSRYLGFQTWSNSAENSQQKKRYFILIPSNTFRDKLNAIDMQMSVYQR